MLNILINRAIEIKEPKIDKEVNEAIEVIETRESNHNILQNSKCSNSINYKRFLKSSKHNQLLNKT